MNNINNQQEEEKKKQVIGLYGEMQLAMILHNKGWQVHRSYIDEGIDFVITKYYCVKCNKFVNQYIRYEEYNKKKCKCVTNLCEKCKGNNTLKIITKYLQVKTSEGIKRDGKDNDVRNFSFHPKIRYMLGKDVYYVWIAIFVNDNFNINNIENQNINIHDAIHYYIFNTDNVTLFDDINLPTYQITDNQKTELPIDKYGHILKKGRNYDYSCFDKFHNNFDILESVN